jgi:hypothetical protein
MNLRVTDQVTIDPVPSSDEDSGASDQLHDQVATIEPFNLKQEKEEGKFDSDGHYSWNKDDYAFEDNWLDGISREEIKKEQMTYLRLSRQKTRH